MQRRCRKIRIGDLIDLRNSSNYLYTLDDPCVEGDDGMGEVINKHGKINDLALVIGLARPSETDGRPWPIILLASGHLGQTTDYRVGAAGAGHVVVCRAGVR